MLFVTLFTSVTIAQSKADQAQEASLDVKYDNEESKRIINVLGVYAINESLTKDKGVLITEYQELEEYNHEALENMPKTIELREAFIELRDRKDFLVTDEFLTRDIFDENFSGKEIAAFFGKKGINRKENYENNRDQIKEIALNQVNPIGDSPKNEVKDRKSQRVKTTPKDATASKENKVQEATSGVSWLLFTIGVVATFVIGFFLGKTRGSHKLEQSTTTKVGSSYLEPSHSEIGQSPIEMKDHEKENLRSQVEDLKDRIKELEDQNRDLKLKLAAAEISLLAGSDSKKEELDQDQDQNQNTNTTVVFDFTPKEVVKQKIYYAAPEDGLFSYVFDKNSATYLLEVSDQQADFQLLVEDKSQLSTFIFNANEFIFSGCQAENAPSATTKDIRIIENGVAQREGDSYRIIKKCKIEFI